MHPVRSCSRDSPEGDPEGGGSPRAPVGPSAGGANAGRPAPPRDGGRLASERRAALRERFRGEHFKGRFRARVPFPLPGHVVLTHGCLRLEGYLHFKERVDVDVVLDLIHFAPEKGAVARAPVCPRAAAATAGGGSSITLEPFAVSVQRIADSPRAGLPLWGRRFLSGRPPPEGTAGGNAGRIAPAAPGEGPVLPPGASHRRASSAAALACSAGASSWCPAHASPGGATSFPTASSSPCSPSFSAPSQAQR